MSTRVVVALGGNAILQRGQKGTEVDQRENVRKTVHQIVRMIEAGYEVVLTHGNGPQVGAILIQNEAGREKVPAMPMDVCGAESQGFIGYMFVQEFKKALLERKLDKEPLCLVTQVEVSADDPAFVNPTKPVGPFYDEATAKARIESSGESWIEDAGRGWRRVVPSPKPINIVERRAVKELADNGYVVVASGGGGIPVVKSDKGGYDGVEAVIDKDLAGELLAQQVNADLFMILTDVPKVALRYGTPDEEWLGKVTIEQMKGYQSEGHFKAGSMGPKVAAAMAFVENGGTRAVIASLDQALEALEGTEGTQIVK
ncbi:MAG: carbamate kinase [Dethiosulfovibrio peptidovorans]|nr:MAG: carbamate kinase [Dethiosulfovibrio peptidovorans]